MLGEALLLEGQSGNLDPILQALINREGSGQLDELGRYGSGGAKHATSN